MKPSEFGNCSYREASLFANSYKKRKETDLKEQIFLFDKATDKMIKMNAFSKKPEYIGLVKDIYKDLFKDELDELVKNGNITMMSDEEKYKYVMELQEELKKGETL